ncbi:NAD(+) diphosphatase [Burkholderiaceae bacterium DAT-1]|nr:NAD(+) diphosphatase [Burkholderiaceae bacterium DAT-1]
MPQFVASVVSPIGIQSDAYRLPFSGQHFLNADASMSVMLEDGRLDKQASTSLFLGYLDQREVWTISLDHVPDGYTAVSLRAAMMQMDETASALAGRAAQLLEWSRTHQFCGVCGTPMEMLVAERARACPSCGHRAWPRINPVMMALIYREGEMLLARQAHFVPGMYSALAGFVEAGESLEDCVHREIMEEVGVKVGNLHYFGSQSWPFPNSLMLAFTAEWISGEIVPQDGEIEDAQWFPIHSLPLIPPEFSISGRLIRATLREMGA